MILLGAAALRLGGIGAESFWHDEALTTTSSRVPVWRAIHSVRYSENCPPGYFILVNLWSKLTPETEGWLRLPSALIGIASIALLFCLGRELFDAKVGLTAAALLALSPFHIAYSQEARPYALLLFLLILCSWAFVRMLRTGSAYAQAGYVAASVAALYTQTFAIFTIAALNLYFALLWVTRRPTGVTLRRWLTLQAAVIVLFGGWIPATMEVARMGLLWMRRPTHFHEAMASFAGCYFALGALTAVCIAGLWIAWRRRDVRVALALLIAVVPVLGPAIYGVFTARYGIGALIGLSLLAAYSAGQFGEAGRVCIVLLAMVNWAATSRLGHARYPHFTPKPDVRSVARHIIEHASPGDVVINRSGPLSNRTLEYYLAGSAFHLANDPATKPAARIWAAMPNDTPPGDLPCVSAAAHRYDGVVLLELRLNQPENRPAAEPVAATRRSD